MLTSPIFKMCVPEHLGNQTMAEFISEMDEDDQSNAIRSHLNTLFMFVMIIEANRKGIVLDDNLDDMREVMHLEMYAYYYGQAIIASIMYRKELMQLIKLYTTR